MGYFKLNIFPYTYSTLLGKWYSECYADEIRRLQSAEHDYLVPRGECDEMDNYCPILFSISACFALGTRLTEDLILKKVKPLVNTTPII